MGSEFSFLLAESKQQQREQFFNRLKQTDAPPTTTYPVREESESGRGEGGGVRYTATAQQRTCLFGKISYRSLNSSISHRVGSGSRRFTFNYISPTDSQQWRRCAMPIERFSIKEEEAEGDIFVFSQF